MSEIDWSKAPEWAEYVVIGPLTGHQYWATDSRRESIDKGAQYIVGGITVSHIDERWTRINPPSEKWNGTGLPPVGTVCEYYWAADDSWRSGTCVAHFDGRAVICDVDDEDCAERLDAHHVRATRTPEQIAAEEREKEIDAICYDIVSHYENPKGSEHYLGLARALHAAGYRKQSAHQPKEP